ncbi:MAG: hypothetical protein ACRC6E_01240 [Fusobacteriaceae bacterium]
MILQNTDIKNGQNKVVMVAIEKNLDLLTGLETIENSKIKELLKHANQLVKIANSTIKRDVTKGPTQQQLDKIDFIWNVEGSDIFAKNLACNILRMGKKAYAFKMLEIKELIFFRENDIVEVVYRDYRIVPNGTKLNEETGKNEIVFYNEIKTAHTVKIAEIPFEGQKYIEINEAILKNAVIGDSNGSKSERLNSLFNVKPDVLDMRNIRTITKNGEKDLENSVLALVEMLESQIKGIELIAKI